MHFARPLVPGRLVKRYKRFLADVELESGPRVTAHCANPGAMTGLAAPGLRVWLEPNDDPKRKLRYGWRLVELAGGGMACVDTAAANRVVEEGLRAGRVAALAGYETIRREVRYGAASRVDFLLTGAGRPDCWLEVKSATLSRGGWAEFPDTVTKRGAKHLDELAAMARSGARAATLYLMQRDDCTRMRLATDIDPAYADAFHRAAAAGVETLAFSTHINLKGVEFGAERPFSPPEPT